MTMLAVLLLAAVLPFTDGQSPSPSQLRGRTGENVDVDASRGKDIPEQLRDFADVDEIRAVEEGNTHWKPCSSNHYPCQDGHRKPSSCMSSFTYDGIEHNGCAPSQFGKEPWCATESPYLGDSKYERCVPCAEQVDRPNDSTWKRIIKDFACTPVVITGGSKSSGRRTLTFVNGYTPAAAQERFPAFSAGKWPGTVAIAGAVHTGHMTWDTRAGEVFEWWTNNPSDPKYRVTLRHLLQFTSGFYLNSPGMGHLQVPCMTLQNLDDKTITMENCARQVYETARFDPSRMSNWPEDNSNYNSMHQVIALAMATKKTGLTPLDYLDKYLYKPAGMKHTTVYPVVRPMLSAFMMTTVDDYDSFLLKYLTYEILPKEIVDVIETNSGDGAGLWINALGHHVGGMVHDWGGGLYASVDRKSQTYQLVSPPIKEYPAGAWAKWNAIHKDVEELLARGDSSLCGSCQNFRGKWQKQAAIATEVRIVQDNCAGTAAISSPSGSSICHARFCGDHLQTDCQNSCRMSRNGLLQWQLNCVDGSEWTWQSF